MIKDENEWIDCNCNFLASIDLYDEKKCNIIIGKPNYYNYTNYNILSTIDLDIIEKFVRKKKLQKIGKFIKYEYNYQYDILETLSIKITEKYLRSKKLENIIEHGES